MNRVKRKSALYAYLQGVGALDKGTEAIKEAKRQYYLEYKRQYMRSHRKVQKEFRFVCSKAEEMAIAFAAKEHSMPASRFVKEAVLSYIKKVYIVKDRQAVAQIKQLLVQAQGAIQRIEAKETKWLFTGNYNSLEDIVTSLRRDIDSHLKYPPDLLDIVYTTIKAQPHFRQQLEQLLSDDTQVSRP